MTQSQIDDRVLGTEQVPVRVVDSDVHPTQRRGELAPFIPAAFRSTIAARQEGIGNSVYYDAPDYARAYAMRVDTFPRTASSPAPIRP